jgi:hypothetical protein
LNPGGPLDPTALAVSLHPCRAGSVMSAIVRKCRSAVPERWPSCRACREMCGAYGHAMAGQPCEAPVIPCLRRRGPAQPPGTARGERRRLLAGRQSGFVTMAAGTVPAAAAQELAAARESAPGRKQSSGDRLRVGVRGKPRLSHFREVGGTAGRIEARTSVSCRCNQAVGRPCRDTTTGYSTQATCGSWNTPMTARSGGSSASRIPA